MPQYANAETRTAYLSDEFGLNLACKKLGMTPEQIENLVGRYTRGKRKGLLRGAVQWFKITQFGWVKMGAYDHDGGGGNGFVQAQGASFGYRIIDAWDGTILKQDADLHITRDNGVDWRNTLYNFLNRTHYERVAQEQAAENQVKP